MSTTHSRLAILNSHFLSQATTKTEGKVGDDKHQYAEVIDHHPHIKTKIDYFNKQGWGYADTALVLD
jgi:hypothetical protein